MPLAVRRLGYEAIPLLFELGCEVPALVTVATDIADGVTLDDYAGLAAAHGAELVVTESLNRQALVTRFRAWAPDLVLALGWRRLVGRQILAASRLGGVNVHMAPLPRLRGFAPLNWAIILGEERSGVTLHHMTERFDDGDIIDQRLFPIGQEDTIDDLERRGRELALAMLRQRLPELAQGTAPRRKQDEREALYAFARVPADGEIDWSRSARDIHRLIRAVTHPYPGAFTFEGLTKIFVWSSRLVRDAPPFVAVPGSVIRWTAGGGALVTTGDGILELLVVQPEGGAEGAAGDRFRSVRSRLGLRPSAAIRAAARAPREGAVT